MQPGLFLEAFGFSTPDETSSSSQSHVGRGRQKGAPVGDLKPSQGGIGMIDKFGKRFQKMIKILVEERLRLLML